MCIRDRCSLNAGEDRFTLSCSMEINPEGKTISAEVYKGIINVRERMNYHDVQKILDKSDKKVLKRSANRSLFFQKFFKIVSCLILFNLAVVNTSLSNICLWYMDNIT